MPVDTSIYANAAPPPVNPLVTMGQVTQLVGGMNQNKLFQQEFAGRQAMGDVIRQSTNPVTGETDWSKAMGLLSQDPRGARMLPEFAAQQIARQANEAALATAQQELQTKRYQAANSALGALLQKTDGKGNLAVTPGDAYVAIADLYRNLVIDQPTAAKFLDAVPRDPAQLPAFLKQAQMLALAPAERKPSVSTVSQGGSVGVLRTGPTGEVEQVGALPVTMTPGEAAEPIEIFDPATNQARKIPKSLFARQTGAAGGGAAVAGGGAPGAAPAGPGVAAAPALGAEAAATEAGSASAKAMNELYAEVGSSGARMYNLQKALEVLQKTSTGPGTETRQYIQSLLLALPGVRSIDIDAVNALKDDAKYFDEARKLLERNAQDQMAKMGAGTEAKLASAVTSNASVKMTQLAAADVLRMDMGLLRYRQAQAMAWEASGSRPEEFNGWAANWNKTTDPRAFLWDMMSEAERRAQLKTMPAKEKSRLLQNIQWAQSNGFY